MYQPNEHIPSLGIEKGIIMVRVIEDEEFIAAVHAVIEKRGRDYVYTAPQCVYSADDGETGSCLFGGVIIEELGIPYNSHWEMQGIGDLLENISLREDVRFQLRSETLRAASVGQHAQDGGRCYAVVETRFDRTLAGSEAWL